MVVSFAGILLVVIAIFGVLGLFRGIRAGALTTGAIFFAFVVVVPKRAVTRREKLWGLVLGLLNGFFIVAIVERYLVTMIQASAARSRVSVGVPALSFGHPTPDTWSVRLVSSSFTLLPPAPSGDLWTRLPLALVVLVLFLAFVFVGTIYGRVSRR